MGNSWAQPRCSEMMTLGSVSTGWGFKAKPGEAQHLDVFVCILHGAHSLLMVFSVCYDSGADWALAGGGSTHSGSCRSGIVSWPSPQLGGAGHWNPPAPLWAEEKAEQRLR